MGQSSYISNEITKIYQDKNISFPLNMAMASAWIMGNLKGINLKVLDVTKTNSLSDYFVLASATNQTQMRAMADQIDEQLREHGATIYSKEGFKNADWLLMDCGDIIVHIFIESAREVYALDNLWANAKSIEIPSSYYFSSEDGNDNTEKEPDTNNYF